LGSGRTRPGRCWSPPATTHSGCARTPRSRCCAGPPPIPASSGKTQRHRLNRGGGRQANAALYRIVIARLRHDQQTKDYLARRIREGKPKKEAIRCLKRYVAREVFAASPR
jgi:transposase